MDLKVRAKKGVFAGLFMVTLATLMYEILLTRIFSVTMWYHFAFMAISIAMFGMTVGAILVYLFPGFFTPERVIYHLSLSAWLFSIVMVLSFLAHLSIPFQKDISLLSLYSLALTYFVIALPFIFSGVCVCLALTRFSEQVSKLYAADLAGAGIGCILLIYLLRIMDGPTTVVAAALLAGIGAIFFLSEERDHRQMLALAVCSCFLLFCFTVVNTILANKQKALIRPMWIKGIYYDKPPLYEKWNSFSYIMIQGDPSSAPMGWGLSEVYPADRYVQRLSLAIDGCALTPLTRFDGDFSQVDFLKYDITNLVHYVRRDSKVLVIGAGGGRDVLSALTFGQKSITAVEINSNIANAANKIYGDFTGHLDQRPGVSFIVDEARSYVARQKEKYDIIEVSLIDTWAATAAGAFILSEQLLYTVEAWKEFMDHLTPNGILSFSYWYNPKDKPGTMYRLTSLARTSLINLGIADPREHIVIVRYLYKTLKPFDTDGVATLLVSKNPFSEQDLTILEDISSQMRFEIVLSPKFALDPVFADIVSGKKLDLGQGRFPINIQAPTDNNPFFFYLLRLRDIFRMRIWKEVGEMAGGGPLIAVFILGALLFITVLLTLVFIIIPLILTSEKSLLKGSLPLFIFFSAIGFGFMLVEISQMQRLIIFLGHPTYGLSVVLFSLLLSSGLGSFLTEKVNASNWKRSGTIRLLILLLVLIIFGIITPGVTHFFRSAITPVRIMAAFGMLFPLGIFMGMAFPLGMKAASQKSAFLTPWLWGINGSTSVCSSVLAIAISLNSNISVTFWTGFFFYGLALFSFAWANQKKSL